MTDAGAYFLKEARQILVHVEQAAETARRIDRGQVGRLVVGFVGSVVHTFLPEGLRLFHERFPDVELVLHELNTAEQVKSLHDGRIDIGFHYPDSGDRTLVPQTITHAPFIVALSRKHPFANRKSLRVAELARESFIAFTRSSEPVIRDTVISMCRSAGFSPRIAQEASQIQTVLGIVASGLGICLIPDYIRHIRRPGVLYKPLTGSPVTVELAVVRRSDNASPLAASFIKVIKTSAHLFR